MNAPHLPFLLLAALGLVACGPSRVPAASSSGGGGDVPKEDVPADPPLSCTPPLVECDGQCVDLSSDSEHCGRCGYNCRIYTPGEFASPGQCQEGLCEPSYRDGSCLSPEATGTCADVCANRGPPDKPGVCVENGCYGGTMVWEPGYKKCDPNFFGCDSPEYSTICGGEDPELAVFQQVGCDVTFGDAFAMTGLPESPPVPYMGKYGDATEATWTARCCCQIDARP